MDLADEVAVMSYRTDMDELQAIARDTLRYGDLVGIPVWLALSSSNGKPGVTWPMPTWMQRGSA
jgi:hypothetical protein